MAAWRKYLRYWPALVWAAVAALAVCLILIAFDVLPGVAAEKSEQAKVMYSAPPAGSGLKFALAPPPTRIEQDRSEVSVIFTNSGPANVRLDHFAAVGCLALVDGDGNPLGKGIPQIPPRKSVALQGYLRSLCGSEQSELAVLYAWSEDSVDGKSSNYYDGFAVTSPISITRTYRQSLSRALKLASAFVHDFSIPVILLGLGVFFNRQQTLRAEKLAREQDSGAKRQAILQTMLPAYSTLVQEHYLPVTRRIDTVISEAAHYYSSLAALTDQSSQEERDRVAANLERLLCTVLLMRRRMLLWLLQRGGIYFVAVSGELLYEALSNAFLGICQQRLGREEFDSAVELLDAEDTVNQALKKFKEWDAQPREAMMKKFSAWVGADCTPDSSDKFGTCVNLLTLMAELFRFECNRPFYERAFTNAGGGINPGARTNWYVDAPQLRFTAEIYVIPAVRREKIFERLKIYLDKGVPILECKGESPNPR